MGSNEFDKNVKSDDIFSIRSALLDYLIIDTSFKKFDKELEHAQKTLQVIEPDNGNDDYDFDKAHWDIKYLNMQKVALMVNFSQKRIDHIKQVIKVVLKDQSSSNSAIHKKTTNSTQQDSKTGRFEISENENTDEEKTSDLIVNIGIVTVVGGLVVTTVGLITASKFITTVGGVVTIAGGFLTATGVVNKLMKSK